MEFLNKLYQYEHFTLILTISIVVLVVLFVVILIFGKKDQKLEETKKLEKLALDSFKEEENTKKLEVAAITKPKIEEADEEFTIDKEPIKEEEIIDEKELENQLEEVMNAPIQDVEEPKNEFEVTTTIYKPEINKELDNQKETVVENEVMTSEEMNKIDEELKDGINRLNELKNEAKNDDVLSNTNIFSSVYVSDEKPAVEQPKIEVEEVSTSEDDDFDMPVLKEDYKEEQMSKTSIHDLVSETYELKK